MAMLTDAQLASALAELPEWANEGAAIRRVVELRDFMAAIALVNRVAELAESANHHPDIDIRWNRVTLVLTTHSEGGVTDLDVALAAQIDAAVAAVSGVLGS